MRAAPAKFLFENDFAAGRRAASRRSRSTSTPRSSSEAEAAAFARGFEQGAAEARAEAEKRSPPRSSASRRRSSVLDTAARGGRSAARNRGGRGGGRGREEARAGAAGARAVRRDRGARHRLLPQSGQVPACGGARERRAARDRARASSTRSCAAAGLDSRLVVLAEPEIAPGDCRIEWADGGIDRDSAAIERRDRRSGGALRQCAAQRRGADGAPCRTSGGGNR